MVMLNPFVTIPDANASVTTLVTAIQTALGDTFDDADPAYILVERVVQSYIAILQQVNAAARQLFPVTADSAALRLYIAEFGLTAPAEATRAELLNLYVRGLQALASGSEDRLITAAIKSNPSITNFRTFVWNAKDTIAGFARIGTRNANTAERDALKLVMEDEQPLEYIWQILDPLIVPYTVGGTVRYAGSVQPKAQVEAALTARMAEKALLKTEVNAWDLSAPLDEIPDVREANLTLNRTFTALLPQRPANWVTATGTFTTLKANLTYSPNATSSSSLRVRRAAGTYSAALTGMTWTGTPTVSGGQVRSTDQGAVETYALPTTNAWSDYRTITDGRNLNDLQVRPTSGDNDKLDVDLAAGHTWNDYAPYARQVRLYIQRNDTDSSVTPGSKILTAAMTVADPVGTSFSPPLSTGAETRITFTSPTRTPSGWSWTQNDRWDFQVATHWTYTWNFATYILNPPTGQSFAPTKGRWLKIYKDSSNAITGQVNSYNASTDTLTLDNRTATGSISNGDSLTIQLGQQHVYEVYSDATLNAPLGSEMRFFKDSNNYVSGTLASTHVDSMINTLYEFTLDNVTIMGTGITDGDTLTLQIRSVTTNYTVPEPERNSAIIDTTRNPDPDTTRLPAYAGVVYVGSVGTINYTQI